MGHMTLDVDTKDPDEIRGAIAILETALARVEPSAVKLAHTPTAVDDGRPSDADWIRFVDNLWPRLGRNARELLKAQATFAESEYWPSEDLAHKLDIAVPQLTGRRANLGRSVKATAEELGVDPGDYELAEYEFDEQADRWIYRLPRGAYRAIARR